MFVRNRVRWRSQRKALRTREAEADARDREHEARQLAALSDRSDSFLAQHADLLASSLPPNASQTGSPRGGGTNGTGGSTPGAPAAAAAGGVKLSFNAAAAKPAAQEAPKARPTALALEDEEETTTKKRELIPLEYSDDDEGAPPKPRMTRTEMERKAREIEEKVPTSKEGLWAFRIRWKRLSDVRFPLALGDFFLRHCPLTHLCRIGHHQATDRTVRESGDRGLPRCGRA